MNNKNIDTIIQRIGFGRAHVIAAALAGIAVMADGMELTLLSLLTTILEEEWELTTLQLGLMAGVVFVGMVIGATTSAILGD